MRPRDVYRAIAERTGAGDPVASATVIRTRGSTPREIGAKMLILADGTTRGTIGGGCGEADVLVVARAMLGEAEGAPARIVQVDLTERIAETSERICGGLMDVLVERWDHPPADLEALASTGGVVRVMPADGSLDPRWNGVYPGRASGAILDEPVRAACEAVLREETSRCLSVPTSAGSMDLFLEHLHAGATLLIVGAGHIAQPLSRLAAMLDYRVVVLDDRPAFASSERFPDADLVVAEPLTEALTRLPIDSRTLAVLVTRGHRLDEVCLRHLLATDARYLGMLGSKRRVRAVFDSLLADGYTRAQLERVWAPVGIEIGAQTPSEIALSVMAELVALRRGRLGGHMKVDPPRGEGVSSRAGASSSS